MFRALSKSVACGLAALVLPSSAALNDAALRDIRIFIVYEPGTGYTDDGDLQQEFYRASRLAMEMYEGIIPSMRVKFVSDRASANILFSVGQHHNTSIANCVTEGNPLGAGFHPVHNPRGWEGCSTPPNNLGYINDDDNEAYNDGTIYFSTGSGTPFRFDHFTYESRQALWSTYQPATLPPINHNDGSGIHGNLGWYKGRFLRQAFENLPLRDAVHYVLHEFGHCFGLGHLQEYLPRSYYGSTPTLMGPYLPLITWPYYGCGTPQSPCQGDLKWGAFKAHSMVDYMTVDSGVPAVALHQFNFRVLRQDAIDYFPPSYAGRLSYPDARNLIRLRTSPTGPVALTSNWTRAVDLAQHANSHVTQSNPYLVTGVYSQGQLQKVAAGNTHVLAIRSDGSLWAWGANDKGQIGDNSTTQRNDPVPILPAIKTWVAVAAGDRFSLALRSDGSLWAWGSRSNGQLGDGVISSTPVLAPKQIGGSEWAAVKAGALHAVALKTDGTLWAWGYNGFGQLGIGGITADQPSPRQEAYLSQEWVGLAAGQVNSAGQRADGTLWTWGWNDNGNVGDGTYDPATQPRQEGWNMSRWQLPGLGFDFSMNLDHEGRLWSWGGNNYGQLGAPSIGMEYLPMERVGGSWVSVSAGHVFAGGIRSDGSLWSWGANESGQLGGGSGVGNISTTPVQEATRAADWMELHTGVNYSLALKHDGSLWAWGSNASGQHGIGSAGGSSAEPVRSRWSNYPLRIEMENPGDIKTGGSVTLRATVTGFPQKVEFYRRDANGVDQLVTGTVTRNGQTFTQTWSNPPIGSHDLVAKAFDYLNTPPAVSGVAGFFVENVVIQTGTVTSANLTTEGTRYWEHYGHASSSDNYTVVRNLSVDHISAQPLNNRTWARATIVTGEPAMPTHSWTNGLAPYGSASSIRKALVPTTSALAVGDGFEFTPMNFGERGTEYTTKLYVYARNVNAVLEVNSPIHAWTHNWTNANGPRVYTIRYRTTQPPVIKFRVTALGTGNPKTVRVQALTLR